MVRILEQFDFTKCEGLFVASTIARDVLKYEILGDNVKTNVPSLKHFIMSKDNTYQIYNKGVTSKTAHHLLAALSSAMRLLQRCSSPFNP